MKKRVREEANSITANCNIKLFGKLEDPTETKDFFEKTVGSAMVTEVSGFQMTGSSELGNYYDSRQAGVQLRPRANYDELRGFKEGQAIITYGDQVFDCAVFYSNPGFAKAMRVTRFMALPPPDDNVIKHASAITKLRDLMVNKTWTAERADVAVETAAEIAALNEGFTKYKKPNVDPVEAAIAALVDVHALSGDIPPPSGEAAPGGATPKAGTPEPKEAPAKAEKTAKSSGGAPPIFGGAPAEPTAKPKTKEAPKPAKEPEKPVSEEEQKLIDAAEDVKKSVFDTKAEESEDKLIKAAEKVKKNVFGKKSGDKEEPAKEEGSADKKGKPSIFGSDSASSEDKDDKKED